MPRVEGVRNVRVGLCVLESTISIAETFQRAACDARACVHVRCHVSTQQLRELRFQQRALSLVTPSRSLGLKIRRPHPPPPRLAVCCFFAAGGEQRERKLRPVPVRGRRSRHQDQVRLRGNRRLPHGLHQRDDPVGACWKRAAGTAVSTFVENT